MSKRTRTDKNEEEKRLKKAAKEAMKKYERYREEKEEKAFADFTKDPTFQTFFDMCEIISESEDYQCADTLSDVGHRIPLPELKKIVEFIQTHGADYKYVECELSVSSIIESHVWASGWGNMSEERLAYLLPLLDTRKYSGGFWEMCMDRGRLRDVTDLSLEEFRTVVHILIKDRKK